MESNIKDKSLSRSDAVFGNSKSIKDYDQELWKSFEHEAIRQEDHIELIASENYASNRVLEAQGSVLTNKYAEGYPSKRYYGGCEYVDIAEEIAISRAKELLPDPDGPVIITSLSFGISTVRFLRLCSRAFKTRMLFFALLFDICPT